MQLVKTFRTWVALAAVAVAALAITTEAQAGKGCCLKAPKVCCKPVVCCEPKPTVTKTITVQSPECCNLCATINVCLPACCAEEEPCITSRCTLLGYGQVKLTWSCGKTVIVRFTKHGPIVL